MSLRASSSATLIKLRSSSTRPFRLPFFGVGNASMPRGRRNRTGGSETTLHPAGVIFAASHRSLARST